MTDPHSQEHFGQPDPLDRLAEQQTDLARTGSSSTVDEQTSDSSVGASSWEEFSTDQLEAGQLQAGQPQAGQLQSGQFQSGQFQSGPGRSGIGLLQLLLSPHAIHALLALGGGLFAVGLIIWLVTLGVFDHPLVVAGALGLGNAAILAAGWAVLKFTGHQTAGRAVTLLGALVMPLNLWFYHTHQLITLEGHLWVAALVICVLYAVIARLVRDAVFAPVLVGGVALTGLLLLFDLGAFWQITAPSCLLVALGLVAIHLERGFPPTEAVADDNPFCRGRFGLAFFWSGQIVLLSGLGLLWGAQVAGDWFYEAGFRALYDGVHLIRPDLATQPWGRPLALLLVSAGVYACVYSDLVVRRVGWYVDAAAILLCWAVVLLVQIVRPALSAETILWALSAVSMAAAASVLLPKRHELQQTLRTLPVLGAWLSLAGMVLSGVLYLRMVLPSQSPWAYEVSFPTVAAMLAATASSCIVSGLMAPIRPRLAAIVQFLGLLSSLWVGSAALLAVGWLDWSAQAPLLMLIPLAASISERRLNHATPQAPLGRLIFSGWSLNWAAHAAVGVIVLLGLPTILGTTLPSAGTQSPLVVALVMAELVLFYGVATVLHRQTRCVFLTAAAACGLVAELTFVAGASVAVTNTALAILGIIVLIIHRIATEVPARLTGEERPDDAQVPLRLGGLSVGRAVFLAANCVATLATAAVILQTGSKLLMRLADPAASGGLELLVLLMVLAPSAWLASCAMKVNSWRWWYRLLAVAQAILAVAVVNTLLQLAPWQKLELLSVALGAVALTVAHAIWFGKPTPQNDLVGQNPPAAPHQQDEQVITLGLWAGSFLVAIPVLVVVMSYRIGGQFHLVQELSMIAAGTLLLTAGLVCRARATTLVGAGLTMAYIFGLLAFVHWKEVQVAAVALTIGGGLLFGAGLLLSVYRDRMLALRDGFQQRKGVFGVLTWR